MFCLEPAQFCISESTKRVDVSWRFLHLQFWSFFWNKKLCECIWCIWAHSPGNHPTIQQPRFQHKKLQPKNLTSKIWLADNVTPNLFLCFSKSEESKPSKRRPGPLLHRPNHRLCSGRVGRLKKSVDFASNQFLYVSQFVAEVFTKWPEKLLCNP